MPGMRVRRIEELRRRIAALEGRGVRDVVVDFGVCEIDGHLPGGGLGPGLVEIAGPAATGFAVALAARALMRGGQLVWLAERKRLRRLGFPWPPGLRWLGVDGRRFLLVLCREPRELLWAAETALGSPAVRVAVIEGTAPDLATGRRLQLAAEKGGGIGLWLAGASTAGLAAARLGLRAEPLPGPGPAWRVAALRVRGGVPFVAELAFDAGSLAFAVVSGPRPAAAQAGERRAG